MKHIYELFIKILEAFLVLFFTPSNAINQLIHCWAEYKLKMCV